MDIEVSLTSGADRITTVTELYEPGFTYLFTEVRVNTPFREPPQNVYTYVGIEQGTVPEFDFFGNDDRDIKYFTESGWYQYRERAWQTLSPTLFDFIFSGEFIGRSTLPVSRAFDSHLPNHYQKPDLQEGYCDQ